MIDDKYIPQFRSIVERWNKVEGALKKAEGILTSAVQPAINELRYAGRRIVDALAICLHRHGEDIAAHSDEDIDRVLLEAEQNCIKAEHDIADAVVLYVHMYINEIVTEFTELDVSAHFHNYFPLKVRIREVNDFVTSSREERGERSEMYDQIMSSYVPDIIQFYKEMQGAEGVIKLQHKKRLAEGKRQRLMLWVSIFAFILAAISVAISIYGYEPFITFAQ